MSELPYMQLYIADYFGDTKHLSCVQHGAYLQILMAMWRHGGALPHDHKKLCRIVGLTQSRWLMIAEDVMAFFTIEGDQITQKRLRKEIEKAQELSEIRSRAGRQGGRPKLRKSKVSAKANGSIPEPVSPNGDTDDKRTATPKDELTKTLDTDHAQALVEHRRGLRKPLTAHTARLLAQKFARCADPNAAADAMMSNGWVGFEPEWLENRAARSRRNGSTRPPRRRTAFDVAMDQIAEAREQAGEREQSDGDGPKTIDITPRHH